jgi:hypothetical protein
MVSSGLLRPPKRRFLQEPHGVTTQKTPFFVFFIVCILVRAVSFECGVLLSDVCYLYVVSFCRATVTGKNLFAVKIQCSSLLFMCQVNSYNNNNNDNKLVLIFLILNHVIWRLYL